MISRVPLTQVQAWTAGELFQLVRSGLAPSRSALAQHSGLAPSTVSLRVETLIRAGLVEERGAADSRGGRPARLLQVSHDAGFVAAAELDAGSTRLALAALDGRVLGEASTIATAGIDDPEELVELLWLEVQALASLHGRSTDQLWGLALGTPAPIARPGGRMVSPAFRPAWHDVDLAALFATVTDVPVLVENDANLHALAESPVEGSPDEATVLAVRLGARIGSGIIAAGRLHRGHHGAAGELGHTRVAGTAMIPCSCSVTDCLESVAGGGAIVERLRARGLAVDSTHDVIRLSRAEAPAVVEVLRDSGALIGTALSAFVNFLDPKTVVLAGEMAECAPLVAAIRAELFRSCLPIVTADLEVRPARAGTEGLILGAVRLILDAVLAPAAINDVVSRLDRGQSA